MKHTPGPWKILSGNYGGVTSINASIRERICTLKETINPKDGNSTNYKANAHLIAAAPEMLEACRQAEITLISWGETSEYSPIRQLLKNAIDKAEGKL
jgi:hypothetical protein